MPTLDLPDQRVVTSTTPATKVLVTSFALPWHLIARNDSGGDITAMRIHFRTHEKGPWSPWESITSGLPVAEGDTISVAETERCGQAIEVELTAASDGLVSLWIAGV